MKPKHFALLSFLISGYFVKAQSDGGGAGNYLAPGQFWGEVVLTEPLSKKWVTQMDLQYNTSNDMFKRFEIFEHTVNYGGRIWLHYFSQPNMKFSASFGSWINTDVKEIDQNADLEYRASAQFLDFTNWGNITFYNRVRYEERFITLLGENNFEHTSRMRYMPKLIVTLNCKSMQSETVYWVLTNELLFNFFKGPVIDQNRLCTGFGYCFTDNITLELTYVNRYNNFIHGHNLTHALSASVSFNNISSWFKKNN